MRLTVRCLGLDLLDIEINTDSPSPEPDCLGDVTSYPVGFTVSHGDMRWEEGLQP